MGQKEKAEELLCKFSILPEGCNNIVIQCAILAVDEIIEALETTTGHCELRLLDRQEVQSDFDFWNGVKDELKAHIKL